MLLELSDNLKQPFFFGGSAGLITGSANPVSLNSVLGVSTYLSGEFWCPSSKGTYVPFSAAILQETRENIFSLVLPLFLKRDVYFS